MIFGAINFLTTYKKNHDSIKSILIKAIPNRALRLGNAFFLFFSKLLNSSYVTYHASIE
jgi:hypothetical protein